MQNKIWYVTNQTKYDISSYPSRTDYTSMISSLVLKYPFLQDEDGSIVSNMISVLQSSCFSLWVHKSNCVYVNISLFQPGQHFILTLSWLRHMFYGFFYMTDIKKSTFIFHHWFFKIYISMWYNLNWIFIYRPNTMADIT